MATPNIVPRADSEGGLGTSSKYWASAYIDNVYVSKVGRDADNLIDFSADNQISIRVNAANELKLNATSLFPITSDGTSLGQAANQWSDLFLASGAVINFDNGNVTLTHSSNALTLADNDVMKFGTGGDLFVYHSGTHSYLSNYTGNLNIDQEVDDGDLQLRCDDGSGGITAYLTLDGGEGHTIVYKEMQFQNNVIARFGTSNAGQIYHSGSVFQIDNIIGNMSINNFADDGDIIFSSDDGSGGVTEYFKLDGTNVRTLFKQSLNLEDNVQLQIGNSQDLKIYHNTSHSFIEQQGTGSLHIRNIVDDGDVVFQSDDGSGGVATYFYLDGSSATHDGSATTALYTNWPDKSRITVGTSHDLQIYHDGSTTMFQNQTGDLKFRNFADDKDIIFETDDGSGSFTTYFKLDGSVAKTIFSMPIEVGANGAGHDVKFFLNASGRYIMVDEDDNSLIFTDNANAKFGNGGDLQLSHDGTDSRIDNMVGHLKIRNYSDDSDIYFESDNGSGGVTEYFRLDGGATRTIFSQDASFGDDTKIIIGASSDLQIFHEAGGTSKVENYVGNLVFQQRADDADIVFQCDDGSGGLAEYFRIDGSQTITTFSKNARVLDDVFLQVGSSADLYLVHSSGDSSIVNGVGDLYIKNGADDKDIIFQCDNGSGGLETYFKLDGSANAGGLPVTVFPDNSLLWIGTDGGGMRFHATGSASEIQNHVGNLTIVNNTDDGDIFFKSDAGDGTTTSYIQLDGSEVSTKILTQKVMIPNLPTSDPSNAGQLWNDSGTLKISAG